MGITSRLDDHNNRDKDTQSFVVRSTKYNPKYYPEPKYEAR
jgi:hypothetical protein